MDNILVVCLDNTVSKHFAKVLAEKLKFEYIDLSIIFDADLLSSINLPFVVIDDILKQKESYNYSEISTKEKVVFSIDNESYLSNNNHENFKNSYTILIKLQKNDKIMLNLQNLLEKYCKFSIFHENDDIMVNKIMGELC